MAVKGKGKQIASDAPAPSSSGAKRRISGGAGPSSSSAAKRRRGVLQYVDDAAGVDDEYEEDEDEEEEEEEEEGQEEDLDDGFFTAGRTKGAAVNKRVERSHPLPFLGHVKEEELSGDELEEFINQRYSNRVRYAGYGGSTEQYDDEEFSMDGVKDPIIWRVKCMVGRERQMAFCFMQKFLDLKKFGTKVPIISAFSLDHVRGFVFVEAEKACDVTEACKGFCNVYVNRTSPVPVAEVPSLLATRAKPFEVSPGTWVRMKSGNYKGDLAQVAGADDGRKRVLIKLIPRVDLHAISKKFGGAISLKDAGVPAPRLISSQELEYFGPHIERRRDRQTGDVFEVLDGLMFKDGFLYKRVAISSLIYWSIQPTDTEILKFSSSPSIKNSADDMDWVSGIYGHNNKKRNVPREQDMNTSTSSKGKSSKASLKGSTSTENYDDDGDGEDAGFNLHDLVLFGRKDFGVIIAVEKDGYKILKGGPEGSAVTVRKQDIKKAILDKMFTAVDHQKKLISMHDTVKVLEGPVQGKQGVVKHLYMGILFIYDEGESENNGFFCAQCGSCENIKKKRDLANSEDNPIPMFSESAFTSSEQNEQRNNERPYRAPREQLFQVGEMLRIRKGPLKGYLCRVVRIFRNDVTVKLDSLLKIVTVQAEFLSVPVKRGDNSSSAPSGNFGTQDTPFSEATKTSWDNGFASLGSDSWQPFSSSALPAQNTGGDTDADPWCKKPWCKKPTADGDSDPWGNKASAAVDVWNNITTEKESSTDNAWDKQAGGGGLDAGGSSWGGGAVNMDSEKSGNWGDAGKQVDMAAGGDTDPWGSKVKEVATEEADPWGSKVKEVATKEADPWGSKVKEVATEEADPWGSKVKEVATEEADPWGNKVKEVATEEADPWGSKVKEVATKEADPWGSKSSGPTGGDGQGWGQSFGKSNQDREKGAVPKDADNSGSWDTAKSDTLPVAQEDAWGKSKDSNNDRAVEWNKAGTSSQNCGSGGWDTVVVGQGQDEAWGKQKDSGAKSEETNNGSGNWNKAGSSDQVGGSDWDKPKFSGGAGSSSWNKGEAADGDNQNSTWSRPAGNFEGGRGFERGRGRGRGRESRDSGDNNNQESWKGSWGNDSSAKPSWGSDTQVSNEGGDSGGYRGRGRGRGQYGGRGGGRDNGWRNGDRGSSEFGRERSCSDAPKWGSSQPWSANEGTKPCDENQTPTWNSSEDKKLSGGEQDDPWGSKIAAKGQEQTDAWSSKLTSTAGADNNDGWNTKAKESSCNTGAKWENAASGKEQETDPWASKVSSVAAEEKADPWNTKGGNGNDGGWNSASSSSWSKPSSSSGDQEPAWNKPKYGDDNAGYGGGGFVRGNRGRGRGRFGDSGSSWNGGSNTNDESGGERSDGGRGRGRGRFGRGDRNQGNNFGSGDGDGGSWGSGRGNRGGRGGGYRNYGNDNNEGRASSQDRGGGGWSHSSAWNADKKGSAEEDQGFSKGKSSWGSGKNDSWGAPKPFGGDDQAGKKDGNNTWSQNKPSSGDGSSILGQWAPAGGTTSGGGASGNGSSILGQWGAPAGDSMVGTGGSWGKSNEDSWNSPKGTEGSGGSKKEGSWDKAEGSGSQGGGGSSSWDKAGGGGWDSSKGGDTSNGGGSGW